MLCSEQGCSGLGGIVINPQDGRPWNATHSPPYRDKGYGELVGDMHPNGMHSCFH